MSMSLSVDFGRGLKPRRSSPSTAVRPRLGQPIPDRIGDSRKEGGVARKLFFGSAVGPRRAHDDIDRRSLRPGGQGGAILLDQLGDEGEADLPAAGQLDIDLREQLRVEQGAMLDPLRAIDAEAGAE